MDGLEHDIETGSVQISNNIHEITAKTAHLFLVYFFFKEYIITAAGLVRISVSGSNNKVKQIATIQPGMA